VNAVVARLSGVVFVVRTVVTHTGDGPDPLRPRWPPAET
jgi:hypothetical protein